MNISNSETQNKYSLCNSPPELQDMRLTVTTYIKNKLKNKKLAPIFEESIFKGALIDTSLNEIKLFKYQLFKHRYNNRLKCIISNITEFENKIKNKEITIDDILTKKPIELFPDKWEESNRRKKEEEKFLYETQLVSNCKSFCFKCKEQNVYFNAKQTRSADEPETVFYKCLSCGNNWKN